MVGGLPGSGKSTLAQAIAEAMDVVVVRSDEVRKEMVGLKHTEAAPASLYATAVSVATYAEVLRRARVALNEGRSVVVDATWSKAVSRTPARELAQEMQVHLLEVCCLASHEVMVARLTERTKEGAHASDAGVAVMEAMGWDDWPEAVEIDTAVEMDELKATAQALAVMVKVMVATRTFDEIG
jgi:predicted kinase